MKTLLPHAETFSITEAVERGLASVVRSAYAGVDFVIEQHGNHKRSSLGLIGSLNLKSLNVIFRAVHSF